MNTTEKTTTTKDIILALIGVAVMLLGFYGVFYIINTTQEDGRPSQISQANDFVNKTTTPNMSISEKIIISKTACDMYYIYSDKNICYEQVINEHI